MPTTPLIQHYWDFLSQPDANGRAIASLKNIKGLQEAHFLRKTTSLAWARFWNYFIADQAQYWVWSDLHLGHKNIISYCERPFSNPHEMNDYLVSQAILHVKPDDYLLFLGDVSFLSPEETKPWIQAMPGRKFLIAGNHDLKKGHFIFEYDKLFEGISAFETVVCQKQTVAFSHYPLDLKKFQSISLNVHGHTHEKPNIDSNHFNMSVEQTAYQPIPLRPLLFK